MSENEVQNSESFVKTFIIESFLLNLFHDQRYYQYDIEVV